MEEISLGPAPISCRTRAVAAPGSPVSNSRAASAHFSNGTLNDPSSSPYVKSTLEFDISKFNPITFFTSTTTSATTNTTSLPGGPDSLPFDLIESASLHFPEDEDWISLLLTPCEFAPKYFLEVAENLLRNPNLTSSCLFRADILYDSEKDPDSLSPDEVEEERGLLKYMKAGLKPVACTHFDEFTKTRVVSRRLVPRNPNLDPELVQTVWFLHKKIPTQSSADIQVEHRHLVVYIPHSKDEDSIPYYHPKVQSLAVLHSYFPALLSGTLSIHLRPFTIPGTNMASHVISPTFDSLLPPQSLPQRLQRTALNFLRIMHKHSTGQHNGYKKRVHHDQLVDQSTFQDTYVYLKQKYAKHLMETWAEVTDPKKHVFEDLGIAAFLIELWREMYGTKQKNESRLCGLLGGGKTAAEISPDFPGFVDIGCGNGVLVYILASEGYHGWGFDVRKRKSWSVFPEFVQDKLKEMILVPEILRQALPDEQSLDKFKEMEAEGNIQNGTFPPGTFIISNHADQLTPWTPILAYTSKCPFISIPCCSHALNGKLKRFYNAMPSTESKRDTMSSIHSSSTTADSKSEFSDDKDQDSASYSPDRSRASSDVTSTSRSQGTDPLLPSRPAAQDSPGPKTGNLGRSARSKKVPMPSAYAGFTAHVMCIARDLGYAVENEVLRIPSTRNHCIVARQRPSDFEPDLGYEKVLRDKKVMALLRSEIGDVADAAKQWVEGALDIKRKAHGQHNSR